MASPSASARSRGRFSSSAGLPLPALHRLETRGWLLREWGNSDNRRQAKFYRVSAKAAANSSRPPLRCRRAMTRLEPPHLSSRVLTALSLSPYTKQLRTGSTRSGLLLFSGVNRGETYDIGAGGNSFVWDGTNGSSVLSPADPALEIVDANGTGLRRATIWCWQSTVGSALQRRRGELSPICVLHMRAQEGCAFVVRLNRY